jgi:DNA-binding MarR family transcriptional regulator
MSRDFRLTVLTSNHRRRTIAIVGTAAKSDDELDAMLEIWAREIPDLDPLTEGIVERIQTLAKAFDRTMEYTLAEWGLDRRSFHVLAKLRSVGAPYRQSAGQLANRMRLSSGAMTNRLDRMEAAGLVRRLPDPSDRRGTLVEPTEAGHATWDRTAGTQAVREARISSALDGTERTELHRLLRALMRAFPRESHGAERPTTPAED